MIYKVGQKKIIGKTDKGEVIIYDSFLIDNAPGYYKLRGTIATNSKMYFSIKNHPKYEKIKNIIDFKYTFQELDYFINSPKFVFNENKIEIINNEKIVLLDNDDMKIYIEYENTGLKEIKNRNELSIIKSIPYIKVEFSGPKKCEDVIQLLKLIHRFFSLMIGFSEEIKSVYCNCIYDNHKLDFIGFDLYFNQSFNHNLNIKDAYSEYRINYEDIKDKIQNIFSKWFEIYNNENYKFPLNLFFLPNENNNIIESEFLNLCKILEYLYILDNYNETDQIMELRENLIGFYEKNKMELMECLKKSGIKVKYANKISKINAEVIENFINKYRYRVTLAQKIKELDKHNVIESIYNENEIINRTDNKIDGYIVIANTRNYYTHLENNNDIINYENTIKYMRKLESIIVYNLLLKIGFNNEDAENIVSNDNYFKWNC